MSRGERIALTKVPESDDKKLIVKSNNEGLGYRYDCYEYWLKNRISSKHFNETVYKCTKICENLWRLQKKE